MAPRKLAKKINFGISIFILHVLCMYLIDMYSYRNPLLSKKKNQSHGTHRLLFMVDIDCIYLISLSF